tara:strand:- start:51889 stop:52200 length:312 start_codon:yes stop_codon:yes gene_type:complete
MKDSLAVEEMFERGSTNKYLGVQIRTYIIEEFAPSEDDAKKAICEVQKMYDSPLVELHMEYHNKDQGFDYDEANARKWIEAQDKILKIAYKGNPPESAFTSAY